MKFMPAAALAVLFCAALLPSSPISAGEPRVIELMDGSLICGEILSLEGGTYKVKSERLGTMEIEESRIIAIRKTSDSEGCGGTQHASDASRRQGFQDLQRTLLSDGEIMDMIDSLQSEPEFNKILQDSSVMSSLLSGDRATLMENHEFMKLMDNQSIRKIQEKLSEKITPPP